LVREGRLHREMEVRQLPSGEWWPISRIKNLPVSALAAAPLRMPSVPCDSGLDLTAVRGSAAPAQVPSCCVSEDALTPTPPAQQSADPVALELTLERMFKRICQYAPTIAQRLPEAEKLPLAGLLCLLIGFAIGSGYSAAHRYSLDAYQKQVTRAERAESDLSVARASLQNANTEKSDAELTSYDEADAPQPAITSGASPKRPRPGRAIELLPNTSVSRLSSLSGETEGSIVAMAERSAKLLADSGIYEGSDTVIMAIGDMYPRSARTVTVAECFASYVTLRKNGQSHMDAVENMKALFVGLGVP
jgi:hypothetical protein